MNNRNRSHASSIESMESRTLFAAGALDTSFSIDGKTTLHAGLPSATDVAVQPDGKTVVAGSSGDVTQDFVVARFNLDGSLDRTFGPGRDGYARTHFGDAGDHANASAVAIQSDGKIVVVGASENNFAIARYNTDGTPDYNFDEDGEKTISFGLTVNAYASAVTIQSDGKIVIAGSATEGFLSIEPDFAVARLKTNGSLDSSFDGDGKRSIALGTSETARSVAIDYSGTAATNPYYGSILVAGESFSKTQGMRLAMIRLNTTGGLVGGFDGDGKLLFAARSRKYAIAFDLLIQSNGNFVLAGVAGATGSSTDYALFRFNRNGVLDTTFGGIGDAGQVFLDLGSGNDTARGVIRNYAGTGFIVAGTTGGQFGIVQFNNNGTRDGSFGTGGIVKTKFTGLSPSVAAIAEGPGRRFVVTGGTDFATARYLQAGANVVYATAFLDPQAAEAGSNQGSFYVFRSERLSTPTRVYIGIGGSATYTTRIIKTPNDYSLTGIVSKFALKATPYVDIPANQTYVQVFLTPTDDTTPEGSETATFTVLANANYEVGTPQAASIFIADNDSVALTATADATVRDGTSATTNFGTSTVLEAKKSGVNNARRGYIKFDLTGTGTINVAKLRLYGGLSINEGAGVATDVFGVSTTTWTESGINWNNRPETGATYLSRTTIIDNAKRLYEWDVTAWVKAQKAAGKTSVTLYLLNQTSSTAVAVFDSRQGVDKPTLIVG